MSILGVIPARGGSKGILKKNIVRLGNKPLIAYTIKEAIKSNLSRIIVTTDNNEIAKISTDNGAEVPFKRPIELAQDTSSSIDVAIHSIKEMEKLDNTSYNGVMYLQPTSPFRSSEDINIALELLEKNEKACSVISVVNVQGYHPARMKYINNGYLIDPDFSEKKENQNRQELTPMYIRNGAIYLTRKEILLKRSFKGEFSLAYEMPLNRSVNIDCQEDLEFANWILSKKL